jgi:hypothetical protein
MPIKFLCGNLNLETVADETEKLHESSRYLLE